LDATQPGFSSGGCFHVDLGYAAPDAKPSLFHKKIPKSGILVGFICEDCHRVFFYAEGDIPIVDEKN
jgi:hypothetical protein